MDGSPKPAQEQQGDLYFTIELKGDPDAGMVVRSFEAHEGLSQLYRVEVELASRRNDVDLTAILDKEALLTVHDRYSGAKRFHHGIVSQAESGDMGDEFTHYRIQIMPTLHRLSYQTDCRIYQRQSVIEVVQSLCDAHGVKDVQFHIFEDHEPREYCTQFNESHCVFLVRITADEGLHFYFEHFEDKHILHISDSSVGAEDCPDAPFLEYNARPGGDTKGAYVQRFSWRENVRPSKKSYRDHVYTHPRATLAHQSTTLHNNGLTRELDAYSYPGRYKDEDVGRVWARFEIEALRSDASYGIGHGKCPHLKPGYHFQLREHDNAKHNRYYLVVSAVHKGIQTPAEEEAAPTEGGTTIHTSFQVIPHATPWRPQRLEKPLMDGPHLGIVTGPEGEEIYVDAFGRVKIYFPWDRHAKKKDDTTSCWIRVASNWAGDGYGHIANPRIGQHVLVQFVDGDCDQPVVTSRYYNGDNVPPYKLPDHKTRSTWRSKTHKGEGFNELRFEDEKGREEVFVHAQKDMNTVIESDETRLIKEDRLTRIHGNEEVRVGKNNNLDILSNYSVTIGGNLVHSVGKLVGIPLVGSTFHQADQAHLLLKQSSTYKSQGNSGATGSYLLSVSGGMNQNIGGDYRVQVGQSASFRISQELSIMSAKSLYISTVEEGHILSGKKLTVESETEIEFICGSAKLSIKDKLIIVNAGPGGKIKLN